MFAHHALMRIKMLTRLKLVLRSAIWAFGVAGFANIEKDAGMAVPQLHAGELGGAKDTALRIEIRGGELDGAFHRARPLAYALPTGVSQ